MAYDFNWHDEEHTIIRIDIHGDIAWDQWYRVTEQTAAQIAKVPYRVDVILNDMVGMPKGNPMPHLKAGSEKLIAQPNMGLIISVSHGNISTIAKTMVDIMMRVYRMDMSHYGGFVPSVDAALKLIAAHRAAHKADV